MVNLLNIEKQLLAPNCFILSSYYLLHFISFIRSCKDLTI